MTFSALGAFIIIILVVVFQFKKLRRHKVASEKEPVRRVCLCMYVCLYVCVCVYIYVYICLYVCMYVCIYIYIYIYICIYACMYMCVCMYIHTYIHICIYMYINIIRKGACPQGMPMYACM